MIKNSHKDQNSVEHCFLDMQIRTHLYAQGPLGNSKNRRLESGQDRATALMSSLQPWLFAQHLHKIKPVNILAYKGEGFLSPHP